MYRAIRHRPLRRTQARQNCRTVTTRSVPISRSPTSTIRRTISLGRMWTKYAPLWTSECPVSALTISIYRPSVPHKWHKNCHGVRREQDILFMETGAHLIAIVLMISSPLAIIIFLCSILTENSKLFKAI